MLFFLTKIIIYHIYLIFKLFKSIQYIFIFSIVFSCCYLCIGKYTLMGPQRSEFIRDICTNISSNAIFYLNKIERKQVALQLWQNIQNLRILLGVVWYVHGCKINFSWTSLYALIHKLITFLCILEIYPSLLNLHLNTVLSVSMVLCECAPKITTTICMVVDTWYKFVVIGK